MRVADYDYELPQELIAQKPLSDRTASRLLTLDGVSGAVADRQFSELLKLLKPDDLMVFNDTRVIPARLYGRKESGGRVEVMVERVLDRDRFMAMVKASKTPRPGVRLMLEGGTWLEVLSRQEEFFEMRLLGTSVMEELEKHGHMPLPPYIRRGAEQSDAERYQTVFARRPGAVAAPTAGLHFDEMTLRRLDEMGVERQHVTLHVGAGTFQPVRVQDIREHRMHAEWVDVPAKTAEAVNRAHREGRRVVAVGTTAVRSLESAVDASGELAPFTGDTRLFIYPGYKFRAIEAMVTNFHLPQSTLLMLVCAFAGKEAVLHAYAHAVAERYRFFSYGDAMFITRAPEASHP